MLAGRQVQDDVFKGYTGMNFNQIDHLLYGGPDLTRASQEINHLMGMAPITGGSHPGKGTRNELLGLTHGAYLEVIGPDASQQVAATWMDVDQFPVNRLFRWAAKCNDLEALVEKAKSAGIDLGDIQSGQRQKPDGSLLTWRLTNPDVLLGDGLIPFFIDWGENGNPTPTLPYAGEILDFYVSHPEPEPIQEMLNALEIDLEVKKAAHAGLVAQLSVPNGIINLS